MKPLADCRLYTFVDSAYLAGRDPRDLARALCDGGSDLIQLRAKDWPEAKVRQVAQEIHPLTQAAGVRLVINDHPEIARDLGVEFLHLGQEDFFDAGHTTVDAFRQQLGAPDLPIGLSTHAPEQAQRAIDAGADYVAIGPIFATPTKPTAKAVTLEYVRWAAKNVKVPWFGIGGVNFENLDEILAAGATRICVVSAILNAPNVAETCRTFRERLPS